jgi:predicted AAA+ superfamily ATPase
MMLSHYHGNLFNASELGRSLSLSYHTVQNYLDILTNTFMIRTLNPWFENIKKRQVKSPKIYFRDSGLLFALQGIESYELLMLSPKLGAAWEGFALEQVIQSLHVDPENCYFWSSHGGAEIDLLIFHKAKKIGFEFKYGSNPQVTHSMKVAMNDLNLDKVYVIHAGDRSYPLAEKIEAVALLDFCLNPREG